MTVSYPPRVEIDGRAATVEEIWSLDTSTQGHFTAMQIGGGRTLGLDFHLKRLDTATREVFGIGLDADRVRVCVIGFIEGDAIVWPDAPALRGVMMQVLQRELESATVSDTDRCA